MGTGTAINFMPTGAAKAAITGDFVLLASEVKPRDENASAKRRRGDGSA
jgi:hypothetical protein